MLAVTVAGAAAVYVTWKQYHDQVSDDPGSDDVSSRSSSQEDSVMARLAKGVYTAIEKFAPSNPDWVIGTGEDDPYESYPAQKTNETVKNEEGTE